jgi:hypothetical protein
MWPHVGISRPGLGNSNSLVHVLSNGWALSANSGGRYLYGGGGRPADCQDTLKLGDRVGVLWTCKRRKGGKVGRFSAL